MNLLESPAGRKSLFFLLYLSEGAPIGFIWWALPAKLKLEGLSILQITEILALVAVPWAFKFLWAPFVDVLRGARFGFRGWIISSQLAMTAMLLPLLWLNPAADFDLFLFFLALHAFFAATQDVAIDGLAISVTRPEERAALNAWMQAGMLVGRSLFGALALRFGYLIGGDALLALVLLLIGVICISLLCVRETLRIAARSTPQGFQRIKLFWSALGRMFSLRTTWLGLLFALLAGAGFEAAGAVAGPFLIATLPAGTTTLAAERYTGDFYLTAVLVMLCGGFFGARLSRRVTKPALLAVIILIMSYFLLALAIGEIAGIKISSYYFTVLTLLYFAIGVFIASSYALFMDISHPLLGATQFSAFMGATNLCESWSAKAFGFLHYHWGYAASFALMAGVSLAALPVLLRISSRSPGDAAADRQARQDANI